MLLQFTLVVVILSSASMFFYIKGGGIENINIKGRVAAAYINMIGDFIIFTCFNLMLWQNINMKNSWEAQKCDIEIDLSDALLSPESSLSSF
jgi:protein-S-isoprenylcysteine O-methyltransferase Ste14